MWHETNPSNNRKAKVHQVLLNVDFLDSVGIVMKDRKKRTISKMHVNSIHHQAVKDIPLNAVSIAQYNIDTESYSDEPMNEALYYPELNIATVQWHPEEIRDLLSALLIKQLLKL